MADILFDELYNVLMNKCVNNTFGKNICDLTYSFVMNEIRKHCPKQNLIIYQSARLRTVYENDIQDCRERVEKIINLFEHTEEKRVKFMRNFPKWKKCRVENVKRLKEIAVELHDEKKAVNAINAVSGVVGVAAGAAIAASILFPPAAIVTIPAWLGGSAVAAVLPSCVLSVVGTTTAATSTLAVAGGAAAVASGATKVVAAVTELSLLKKHLDEAKDILSEDRKRFKCLQDLFSHTNQFSEAVEGIFNFQTIDYVLKDVFEFLDLVKTFKNEIRACLNLKNMFLNFLKKCDLPIPIEYRIALMGIVFLVFLIYKKNYLLFNSIVGVQQIITGNLSMINAFGALTTKSVVTSAGTAGRVMARNVALFTFAGIGMALDAVTTVRSFIEMEKGSISEHGKMVEEAANELYRDFYLVEEVYKKLQYSMLESMFLESQKPL